MQADTTIEELRKQLEDKNKAIADLLGTHISFAKGQQLREAFEAAVFAIHLFDYNDEEDVTRYVIRWRTIKKCLTEPHFGDCTGAPLSCSRCHAEWIMEIVARFERDVTTTEPDDLDWDWRCFLCGGGMYTINPSNRLTPHYAKHRLARDSFPSILICDSCSGKLNVSNS